MLRIIYSIYTFICHLPNFTRDPRVNISPREEGVREGRERESCSGGTMRLCIALALETSHSCSRCHVVLIRDAGKPQRAWDPSEWILRPIQPRAGAKYKHASLSFCCKGDAAPRIRWSDDNCGTRASPTDPGDRASERADNGPLRGNPGSVLIWVTVHNDN